MGFTERVLVREQQVPREGQNQIKLAFEKAHSVYGGEKSCGWGKSLQEEGWRWETTEEAENMAA